MKHILPVPSWCVQTQSFDEHIARAKAMNCAYKPGMQGYSCLYYGGDDTAPPWARANEDIPITASCTAPISAINDESPNGYGLNVRQQTNDGELVIYAHLSRTNVYVGQVVKAGDIIGFMGSTGNSTGKHLHWEIRENGIPVDPRSKLTEKPEEVEQPTNYTPIVIPDMPKAKVSRLVTNGLRVRAEPKDGRTISWLYAGDMVTILGRKLINGDYWYIIQAGDTVGWAAGYYSGEIWLEVV